MILGIDTCGDDTCAALVERDGRVRASVVSSRGLDDRYGMPLADPGPRRHLELVDVCVEDALVRACAELDEIKLVAVGCGPGVAGGVSVGLGAAKAIAATRHLPLAIVDEPHAAAAAHLLAPGALAPPFACLVADAGRTLLLGVPEAGEAVSLGVACDDEPADLLAKVARMGGAGGGGGTAVALPVPPAGIELTLAGVKTALQRAADRGAEGLAAVAVESVAGALAGWAQAGLARAGLTTIGVCAAPPLAAALVARLEAAGLEVHPLPEERRRDRGAMVAGAARWGTPLLPGAYADLDG